jgi:hypothetical protein
MPRSPSPVGGVVETTGLPEGLAGAAAELLAPPASAGVSLPWK